MYSYRMALVTKHVKLSRAWEFDVTYNGKLIRTRWILFLQMASRLRNITSLFYCNCKLRNIIILISYLYLECDGRILLRITYLCFVGVFFLLYLRYINSDITNNKHQVKNMIIKKMLFMKKFFSFQIIFFFMITWTTVLHLSSKFLKFLIYYQSSFSKCQVSFIQNTWLFYFIFLSSLNINGRIVIHNPFICDNILLA